MSRLLSPRTWKMLFTLLLGAVMLYSGFQFICSEGVKFNQISDALAQSDREWLYLGAALTVGYMMLHALMYREGFRAFGAEVRLSTMVRLYLKRNFLGVFLPLGFLSSQAFFTKEVVRIEKVGEREVAAASSVFATAGLLSMVIVVIPALGWLLTQNVLPNGAAWAFLLVSALLLVLFWAVLNFLQKGLAYRVLSQHAPALTRRLDDQGWGAFQAKYVTRAVLLSCVVELIGVLHVWISGKALGLDMTVTAAFAGYMAVLVVLMTAPLLRGAGAVEALLAFVLMRYGISSVGAVSTAVLFRLLEFWSLLLLAVPVFLFHPKSLMVRLTPSMLLFALGIVSIISSLTPAIPERLHALIDYLPLSAIHASTMLTLVVGFFLIGTALYLLRGFRVAWWVALGLSGISLVSHLAKGIDYEESTLALLTILALLYQGGEYNVRTDFSYVKRAWLAAALVAITVLGIGSLGYYLLDQRHFGADFGFWDSTLFALQTFLLSEPGQLHPLTAFGREFLDSMHLLGMLNSLFFAYALFRPLLPHVDMETDDRQKAQDLVKQYGRSSLDYFKTYADKHYFFAPGGQTFIAYKNTSRYSLVLEDPVAPDPSEMKAAVQAFDRFCKQKGLKSIYYRIPESSEAIYRELGKSLLPLGQEAWVHLNRFSLEGKEKKALRNAVNKMEREGYRFVVYESPINGRTLQQLRAVSDEWLKMLHREEMNFSQGIFDEQELRNQTILTLEDQEGRVFAFVNLIPGATASEANFDLMRRTADAPPGAMDYMFVRMFEYLRDKGFEKCNLGLAPMSGLEQPHSLPENLIKLAYERLPRFSGYKSLRFFKEKFDPEWQTRFVAYDTQLDLVNLPLALSKAVKL